MRVTIDGKILKTESGETLLDLARRSGIEIPTLCHHEAVEAVGACRLCTVEVGHADWGNKKDYVASCLYPVTEGLSVLTQSDGVRTIRKEMADLLLARCPHTPEISELATQYGIEKSSYPPRENPDDCILCTRCTRVCEALGFSAIGTAGRGQEKYIATPLNEAPPDCTGCLSCAHVCPTGHIKYEKTVSAVRIWDRAFELLKCESCGRGHITREYAEAVSRRPGMTPEHLAKCEICSRQEQVSLMDGIAQWESR